MGKKSLERTSEANLDTQSSDISAVENRESGRSPGGGYSHFFVDT